jgi:hypothetical protein
MATVIPAVPAVAALSPAAAGASPRPPERSFAAALQRAQARPEAVQGVGLGRDAGRPAGGAAVEGGAGLLEVVDRARARLDGVLAAARSGRAFSAGELLGLQAEAYRTVQTVDLATRLVEQGAQSVKQALAAQV